MGRLCIGLIDYAGCEDCIFWGRDSHECEADPSEFLDNLDIDRPAVFCGCFTLRARQYLADHPQRP